MSVSADGFFSGHVGLKKPPQPEHEDALNLLHEEKSPVQRVMIFDKWLTAHGFQKATVMDPKLSNHVDSSEVFFYYRWHKKTLLVATIRKGEILLWMQQPGQERLCLDKDAPHMRDVQATCHIKELD